MVLKRIKKVASLSNILKCKKIFFSKLFDASYYSGRYSDVPATGVGSLLHYCYSGYREQRRPSLLFDNLYYLRRYAQEIVDNDPLLHYIEEGWRRGNNPNRYFDTNYYLKRYRKSVSNSQNPLLHYLNEGWRHGYLPSEMFSRGDLKDLILRSKDNGKNPLLVVLQQDENIRNTVPPYFDTGWYRDQVPALPNNLLALWHHYIDYGVHEGKTPLPLFQSGCSLSTAGKLDLPIIEPFADYRKREKLEKLRPEEWFDPEYYRAVYPVRDNWKESMLEHYLNVGVFSNVYTDQRIADLQEKPVISILVPVYNPKPHHLNNCIRSVLYQAYPHWELCLCDDCSTETYVTDILNRWSTLDERIKVICHKSNGGISKATNSAATLATGTYIGLLDNDDELTVDCLYQVVKAINETDADMVYTDEDLIGDDGRRFSTFFKPGYNRELLHCHNYITHFVVVLRDLFGEVGGCDTEFDGAQDFDLVLKLSEIAKRVVHVPEIVYHWRASETSTSINHDQKSYADDAGKKAVEKMLERNGISGEVETTDWKYYYRLRRQIISPAHVTVVLFLEEWNEAHVNNTITRIMDTAYISFDVLLVYGSDDRLVKERLFEIAANFNKVSCFVGGGKDSKAELLNNAVQQAEGQYLLFLSSEVEPRTSSWLAILMECAQSAEVGSVGGRLFPASGFWEVNTIPDIHCESPLYLRQFLQDCSVHMNGLQWTQEVMSPPVELMLVRKTTFSAVKGFRADYFPSLFTGIDFNYRLRQKGYLNILNPYCEAEWITDKIMLRELEMKEDWLYERQRFQNIWPELLYDGDPYYHPGCYREKGITDEEFLQWCLGSDSVNNSV